MIEDETEEDEGGTHLAFEIPEELGGERLDKALARLVAQGGPGESLSRSRLKALTEAGRVLLDGHPAPDASRRVRPGQRVGIEVPAPVPASPEPEAIPLDIVYEDEDLLVVDKPAGLVVHPAAGNPRGTLVNALLHHCGDRLSGIGGIRRPGIVHRLDKDTSGLMVVAKTDLAHAGLTAQFQDRSLSRTYRAVLLGLPGTTSGIVDAPIGRAATDRKRMAVTASGKPAVTRWRLLKGFGLHACLVECRLETGRTHQIRVHMAHAGHPVLGDPVYAAGRPGRAALARLRTLPEPARNLVVGFPRQALHAVEIRFRHPGTKAAMRFCSDLPLEIRDLIGTLESI